jgi:hypothetical protein
MCDCGEKAVYYSNEAAEFGRKLVQVAVDGRKWRTLYVCPTCGTFWEEVYPHSEQHGGGPPELHKISDEMAQARYGLT